MTRHGLKCLPRFFQPTMRLDKRFEIRRDDRAFLKGDELWLREWDKSTGKYTGLELVCEVLHTLRDAPGLARGYVLMSIKVEETINLNPAKEKAEKE